MATTDEPLLLTAKEAGRRLGVSHQTVRRLAATRGLPYVSIGREVRYPAAGLAAWVAAQANAERDPHPGQPHDPERRVQVANARASVVQVCRLCGVVMDPT